MTGKKKGKTRQTVDTASSNLDPSKKGPSISQQKKRKGVNATGPNDHCGTGILKFESAQAGNATMALNASNNSGPRSKPRSAVRDGTVFDEKASVSLRTGSRTSGSPLDLGHGNYLYPPKPELDVVPVKAKLLRRFYEPLVLLHVLDPSRGSRIPQSISNGDCKNKLRRSFIDSVAYICDYKKGGDTCTAAAMQEEPDRVTIWLAANTNIKEKTKCFLEGVLDCLVAITDSNRTEIEDSLAVRIIDFNEERLQAYKSFVRTPLSECLKKLEQKYDGECYSYGAVMYD